MTLRPLPYFMLLLPCLAGAFVPALAAANACESLTALKIPDVVVKAASSVPAGPFTPPGAQKPITLPSFCRVEAEAHPTSDSEIQFEVWIPPAATWNGKFEGVGNGGYEGSIDYRAMAAGLELGYATASTDTGHTGGDLAFGIDHPEEVIDWSYRAIHVTAEISKLIVRDYAGRFPAQSYFDGCSTGGHQALSEAQRFPEDYNGIIAGDPAFDRLHETAAYVWSWAATHKDGKPLLSSADLHLVTKAAVAACDAADGIKDGVIDDPRRCHFDPAALLCHGAKNDSCLTAPQVEAVKKVHAGLRNPRTGEQIFPGWAIGSEGFGPAPNMGWGAFLVNPPEPMRVEVYRDFLFDDPNWDWHTMDFDKDVSYADAQIGYMSAVNPDLSGFKARGGKLLMYTGWDDPILPPQDVMNYYEAVVKKMGGLEKTQEFARLFMAPGMGHCGGGPGPNTFDTLGTLDQWVESGVAPQKIIASHSAAGVTDRTRPLCPYPQVAKWKGKGSTDDAANFMCASESPAPGGASGRKR